MTRTRPPGRNAVLALVALAVCQVGAYVAAPGLDGRVLGAYFRARRAAGGTGLLGLYDRLAGGALSRGALLALGVLPYLSAWTIVRLARLVVPAARGRAARDDGRATLRRWTRALTVVLALVQSAGFARFAERVPGVVSSPGPAFVLRTMLVLTAGALAVMWLGERMTGDDDAADDDLAGDAALAPAGPALLAAPAPVVTMPDLAAAGRRGAAAEHAPRGTRR